MLAGMPVSAGFVDKASSRLDCRLQDARFDEAIQAALAQEPALGADETPVNVLTPDNDPETGSPHVLVIRAPGQKLTWLRALGSRRAAAITAILEFFTGFLITDGYTAYQLAVHRRTRRRMDQQRLRTRRQSNQAAPGRLRVLAHPGDACPLVPHP
jgi:Transposase IS66 family